MQVQVTTPSEYQGPCIALLNRRKALINDSSSSSNDNDQGNNDQTLEIGASVPLNDMFGFSTDLRSISQGKAEFSMRYEAHLPVLPNIQQKLVKEYQVNQQRK